MTRVRLLQMMPIGQPQVTVLSQQHQQPQMMQPVAMAQPPAYQRMYYDYALYNNNYYCNYYKLLTFFSESCLLRGLLQTLSH